MGRREYDSLQLIKKGNAKVDMKGKNLVIEYFCSARKKGTGG
jgi:hypothetical protein